MFAFQPHDIDNAARAGKQYAKDPAKIPHMSPPSNMTRQLVLPYRA